MSASAFTPLWKRLLIRFLPFLFRRCAELNYHWRWDVLCFCACSGGGGGRWRPGGGPIVNLRNGATYVYSPRGGNMEMLDISGLSTADQMRIISAWQAALARCAPHGQSPLSKTSEVDPKSLHAPHDASWRKSQEDGRA